MHRRARGLVEAATACATAEWLAEQMAAGRSHADAEAEIDASGRHLLSLPLGELGAVLY